jgi:hypothetical protein
MPLVICTIVLTTLRLDFSSFSGILIWSLNHAVA